MTLGSRLDPDPNHSLAKRRGEICICQGNNVRCGLNPRSDRIVASQDACVWEWYPKFFVDLPGYMLLGQGHNTTLSLGRWFHALTQFREKTHTKKLWGNSFASRTPVFNLWTDQS